MDYTLEINSNKGKLNVTWKNIENLAKYANTQSGFYLMDSKCLDSSLFLEHFQKWNQMFWNQRQSQGMFNFPDNATIVDIGSGMSVVDLLLYSYIPNSKFYLIDNEGWDENFVNPTTSKVCFSENYPIYNSWAPVQDAIESSNFDQSRFIFQNTEQPFPENIDVITSYLSWCFHYPKSTYWEQATSSLKKGGKLILDVRPLKDQDVIGEISEELKSEPVKFLFPILPKYVDNYPPIDPNASGYRCMWEKK